MARLFFLILGMEYILDRSKEYSSVVASSWASALEVLPHIMSAENNSFLISFPNVWASRIGPPVAHRVELETLQGTPMSLVTVSSCSNPSWSAAPLLVQEPHVLLRPLVEEPLVVSHWLFALIMTPVACLPGVKHYSNQVGRLLEYTMPIFLGSSCRQEPSLSTSYVHWKMCWKPPFYIREVAPGYYNL